MHLLTLLLGFLLFSADLPAKPADRTLRFAVYTTNAAAPFIYRNDSGQMTGIVPRLLEITAEQEGVTIEYVAASRKRGEAQLYSAEVDAMLLSPEWTQYPDKLRFSEPFLEHKEYLYGLSPFATDKQPHHWMHQNPVCVREDYTYRVLQNMVSDHGISLVKLSSYPEMFAMLQSGRCSLVYMAEHEVQWLLNRHYADLRVYRSPRPIEVTQSTIAVIPEWQPFLLKFNQVTHRLGQSGELERIVRQSYID